ncbi:hypothetical protein GEMRC1_002770 [Eukaryota sp. GEM-RC1]
MSRTISAAVPNFTSDILNSLRSGSMSDVIVTVQNDSFNAHKLILSVVSPVFHTMLNKDFKEGITGEVNIPDQDPNAFQVFLDFIYTSKLDCNVTLLAPLLELGQRYQVLPLVSLCLELLCDELTPVELLDSCNQLFSADSPLRSDESFESAVTKICNNFHDVVSQPIFSSLHYPFLLKLLSLPLNLTSEVSLFTSLVEWTQHQSGGIEGNLEKFREIMCKVDFVRMTPDELLKTVYPFQEYLPLDHFSNCLLFCLNENTPVKRNERKNSAVIATTSSSRTTKVEFSSSLKHDDIILHSSTRIGSRVGGHRSILGNYPLQTGQIYSWKVRILRKPHWHFTGVAPKSKVTYECDYSIGYGCSSASQHYKTTGTLSNWETGDVIEVTVDLKTDKLRIKEITRNSTDVSCTLPKLEGDEWYPLFNLHRTDNELELID